MQVAYTQWLLYLKFATQRKRHLTIVIFIITYVFKDKTASDYCQTQ